jgi:phosphohistidine phosphatase SixA
VEIGRRSPPPWPLSSLPRILRLLPWLAGIAAAAALVLTPETAAATDPAQQAQLVQSLRQGGLVVLIRHAETAPGVGDPPGFRHDDCPTQRNLSDAGRAQASRLGQWFRQHGLEPTQVRASPWCRTRETAMLAFGRSVDWTALSNLIGDRSRQAEHAREVLDVIAKVEPPDLLVLVSHGVTISAFIDQYLQQGELVVVRPARRDTSGGRAGLEVVGRLKVP